MECASFRAVPFWERFVFMEVSPLNLWEVTLYREEHSFMKQVSFKKGACFSKVQYCEKVMQGIIAEYRALFSRLIADKSAKYPAKR